MEFTENRTYKLHLSDHTKLFNVFITYAIVALVLIVGLSLSAELFGEQFAPYVYMIGIGCITLVGPVLLLLYYNRFLIQKVQISLSIQGIETNNGESFPYSTIKNVKKIINGNGYNSLLIVVLNDGKKYAISPTNKFARLALNDFTDFVAELDDVLERNTPQKST